MSAKVIRHVVLDCDGVLSSGKQYVDQTGCKLFKDFHSRDIRAIRELLSYGVEVIVMTADDWPGTLAWCERVGARLVCTRDKLDAVVVEHLDPSVTVVVGDDAWDVQAMEWATYKACPRDADLSVTSIRHVMVLGACGGGGVVAELVRELRARGLL